MMNLTWYTYTGRFEVEKTEIVTSFTEGMAKVKARYPDAKVAEEAVDDCEEGHFRIVAKSAGGRAGRNVAVLDEVYAEVSS